MTNEELKIELCNICENVVIDEADANGWIVANIEASNWLIFAQTLHRHSLLQFNFLFCLTAIDWKTKLTMVYHLRSTINKHEVVVKIQLERNQPEIETVSHIWRTAEFHEREVFELFGVNFLNHPDLRLLILPDGWEEKKPLLKDFEDPINMIRL